MSIDIDKKLEEDYLYPDPNDPDIQEKLYKKREYYFHKANESVDFNDYNAVKEHRDSICGRRDVLYPHQSLVKNLITPNTPYTGILLFHQLGTGKTCAAISIAENFKEQVQKYNTKIYVLVGGPMLKESWKEQLLICTGETYLKKTSKTLLKEDMDKEKANALNTALQYYKFMSYKSFYKRVIGERILDKDTEQGKTVYRKTEEGEFERDIAVDRIHNLDNSLLIVDEAHNLTDNDYGESLKKIINNSKNLRVVLLTATPGKNLGSDIVKLLNFIRPQDSQIEEDKIFTNDKIHLIALKPGGLEYFKKMASGYVSYIRGDPLIFAKRHDMGEIPKGLLFTPVTRCFMSAFQKEAYDITMKEVELDSLDRKSGSVVNFVFPGLNIKKDKLIGYHGREGINIVKNQLNLYSEKINKLISKDILGLDTEIPDLLYLIDGGKTISGKIFQIENLKYFSTKFYEALRKINRLVEGDLGAKTAFIYSNLVKVGIDLFHQVLIHNGYLEYNEDYNNYNISENTLCYLCGKKYSDHKEKNIKSHEFRPSTFIKFTGKTEEEGIEYVPEEKQKIISEVFNDIENKKGKYVKFILGSKVMNEGISLKQCGEVHILDVYYNLTKVDQTIGRAIRNCSHYKLMNEENKFPEVKVYKYIVGIDDNTMSSEEILYSKAEQKHILVKKMERALKEVSIDCPLNYENNIFKEEIEQYKDCLPVENVSEYQPNICPSFCEYDKCEYICENKILNNKYYDPSRKIYKKLKREDLDYSTFTNALARAEIDFCKKKIKELYIKKYYYTVDKILNKVKNSYDKDKHDLFDNFFVYKALDELIPITENDFNNYKDTMYDKYNRPGYLIYSDTYYIFQPFDQKEDIPMYYRTNFDKTLTNESSLHNYLKSNEKYIAYKKKSKLESKDEVKEFTYNFDSTMFYYENRNEFKYVGIIDREPNRGKNTDEVRDTFKIRESRGKILKKKREKGVPSMFGSVCSTSKTRQYLEKIAKHLGIHLNKKEQREVICEKIKETLMGLEKYQVGDKKTTFLMVPYDHSVYPFPYNLEDRTQYTIEKLEHKIKGIKTSVTKKKKGDLIVSYTIKIPNKGLDEHKKFLESISTLEGNDWVIVID